MVYSIIKRIMDLQAGAGPNSVPTGDDINGGIEKNDIDDDDVSSVLSSDSGVTAWSSSSSSSLVSSSSSDGGGVSLTLTQRQALNIERNAKFLGALRDKYADVINLPTKTATVQDENDNDCKYEEDCIHGVDEGINCGMIMPGSHRLFRSSRKKHFENNYDYAEGIQELERIYPHREMQIRQLSAILSASISLSSTLKICSNTNDRQVYVPAPVFCTGPKGTGKTSIVCDVIEFLSSSSSSSSRSGQQQEEKTRPASFEKMKSNTNCIDEVQVRPAYVDCSIVEPSSIERLVFLIYQQLRPSSRSLVDSMATAPSKTKGWNKLSGKKRKFKREKHQQIQNNRQDNLYRTQQQQQDLQSKNIDDDQKDHQRILPSRRAKRAATRKSLATNVTTYDDAMKKRRRKSNYDKNGGEYYDDEENVETSHSSAVMSLGRSLQRYYGGGEGSASKLRVQYVGILVLDKAEELLSLSSVGKKKTGGPVTLSTTAAAAVATTTSNFLSELLILPKVMKLNITVIAITNYATLDVTRLNNSVAPSRSLSTISTAVHPMIVQFPAYKGNQVFQEILTTEQNQKLVMGDSMDSDDNAVVTMRSSLKSELIRSFWNTVVQFASDSTRDTRDFLRLGRSLWPQFVAPLHPSVLRNTMEGVSKKIGIILSKRILQDENEYAKVEKELVRVLGTKFHKQIADLASGEDNLTLLTLDESGMVPSFGRIGTPLGKSISQPYYRNCLLLAAFICQYNKADQDRKLFSVDGNGKRRKSRLNKDIYGGNDEDLAFGSTSVSSGGTGQHQVEQLKSLRLRPVSLERVFSIFVTLVRLNITNEDAEDLEVTMENLGSTRIYADLFHLIDIGYLHPAKGNDQIHFSSAKFLCSLTKDEALEISSQIGIPLEKYLI